MIGSFLGKNCQILSDIAVATAEILTGYLGNRFQMAGIHTATTGNSGNELVFEFNSEFVICICERGTAQQSSAKVISVMQFRQLSTGYRRNHVAYILSHVQWDDRLLAEEVSDDE